MSCTARARVLGRVSAPCHRTAAGDSALRFCPTGCGREDGAALHDRAVPRGREMQSPRRSRHPSGYSGVHAPCGGLRDSGAATPGQLAYAGTPRKDLPRKWSRCQEGKARVRTRRKRAGCTLSWCGGRSNTSSAWQVRLTWEPYRFSTKQSIPASAPAPPLWSSAWKACRFVTVQAYVPCCRPDWRSSRLGLSVMSRARYSPRWPA